jgi:hypothetical protein
MRYTIVVTSPLYATRRVSHTAAQDADAVEHARALAAKLPADAAPVASVYRNRGWRGLELVEQVRP